MASIITPTSFQIKIKEDHVVKGIKTLNETLFSLGNITNVDSPYSASNGQIIFADCSGGNIAISLPDKTIIGNEVTVIKIDASQNTLTVDSFEMPTQNLSYRFRTNGTDYYII